MSRPAPFGSFPRVMEVAGELRARRWQAMALLIALLVSLAAARPGHAADWAPRPPCGEGDPAPPYAELNARPEWRGESLRNWQPPACTGWQPLPSATVVALAGRFRHEGSGDVLLERFGAISRFDGVRYWSTSRGGWRELFSDSRGVTSARGDTARPDFTPDELRSGRDFYFHQYDNGLGAEAVHRLRVRQASADRLVVAVENATAAGPWLFSIPPGELQSLYFVERLPDGDVWGFYSLTRTTSSLAASRVKSFANRATAIFRHVAGMRTDTEPPTAP
jgi:hypothetical protein